MRRYDRVLRDISKRNKITFTILCQIFRRLYKSIKKYISDCILKKPEKRLIIKIIHDESTFSAYDGRKKV